jgi:mannose-6-phosphate isomerase-like protein (cupin superfamily)
LAAAVVDGLDFIYFPSRDVAAEMQVFTDGLGAELVFAIEAFGTRVAMVRLSPTPPALLLAGHLAGDRPVLVYRVADLEQAVAELNAKLPGMMDHMEPDNPGMHTTDTVDLDLIVTGELDLELDDGAEVHLRPGDCVVQNGTRHAWHNRTSEPCTMLSILVGAKRA